MSWKYVFNTYLKFTGGSTIDNILKFVKTTGYNFFVFNGKIFDLQGNDIGISVHDLY